MDSEQQRIKKQLGNSLNNTNLTSQDQFDLAETLYFAVVGQRVEGFY